ncbi:hypothetical protein BCV70DRAFT_230175 [Testicularia cyperi]|uniref:Uncharacterized protein n=1 Tax=Testicularia cyperi TaxID=1882483 RepID=A0A317XVN4_9BASI|nr:hypothetical protein BCV70DRAFT_230175 [Testicularia cyperi]
MQLCPVTEALDTAAASTGLGWGTSTDRSASLQPNLARLPKSARSTSDLARNHRPHSRSAPSTALARRLWHAVQSGTATCATRTNRALQKPSCARNPRILPDLLGFARALSCASCYLAPALMLSKERNSRAPLDVNRSKGSSVSVSRSDACVHCGRHIFGVKRPEVSSQQRMGAAHYELGPSLNGSDNS